MAKATFVKKARKAIPPDVCGIDGGIAKGTPYFWWKFRFGRKRYSISAPRRSQLTQSDFYAALWGIEDEAIANLTADSGLPDAINMIINDLRALAEEQEEKILNMPESLQESDTAQLLQERADALNAAADEFENIDFDDQDWKAKLEEAQSISIDA